MTPASTTCPKCGTTMWVGSLHFCDYRREVPAERSRVGTFLALAALAFGAGLLIGWAVWRGIRA